MFKKILCLLTVCFYSSSLFPMTSTPADPIKKIGFKIDLIKTKIHLIKRSLQETKNAILGLSTTQFRTKLLESKELISGTKLNETKLTYLAETQGLGYKTANLIQLNELATILNAFYIPEISFAVPEFRAISSDKIKAFLAATGLDVQTAWTGVIKGQNQTNIKTAKIFTSSFLEKLKQLEEQIRGKFSNVTGTNMQGIFNLSTDKLEQVDSLIVSAKSHNLRLMVRSTGAEDTKNNSNAGGNLSKANVEPELENIIAAIGEVIASYFGEKSFTQRLRANDPDIFNLPMTPVLIQVMSGEKPNGEEKSENIPSVGVMYTEEPNGGLFRNYAKTQTSAKEYSGITQIQSAYGHNEAIVTGAVNADTYYIDELGMIYYIVKNKTNRLIPIQTSGELTFQENPKELRKIPALNEQTLFGLKVLANALEKYYEWPMDVEFVVKKDEKNPKLKIINIVQARPITYKKDLPEPCYIKDLALIKNEKLACQVVGFAGGALQFINRKDQLIIADSLPEALSEYITKKPEDIQCIVVNKDPLATSHEAAIFRGEGKAVIQLNEPEFKKLKSWTDQEKLKIIIDVQRGLVIDWSDQTGSNINGALGQNITNGWLNYPIPPLASIILPKTHPIKNFPEENELKFDLGKTKGEKISDLINKIKTTTKSLAAKSFKLLLIELLLAQKQLKKQISESPVLGISYLNNIKQLNRYIETIAPFIKLELPPQDTRRLFVFQFLQAALNQPYSDKIVKGFSFAQIAHDVKKEAALIKAEKIEDPFVVQYLKLNEQSFTPELSKSWNDFIASFELMKHEKSKAIKAEPAKFKEFRILEVQFNGLLKNLGDLDILPLWLHLSFLEKYQPTATEQTMKDLIKDYTDSKELLAVLLEKNQKLKDFDLGGFGEKAKFKKSLNLFEKVFITYFTSHDFLNTFKTTNTSNLAKVAALQTMNLFVSKFDDSIKSLKSSTDFELKDKVANFQMMLKKYFHILESFSTACSDEQKTKLAPSKFTQHLLNTTLPSVNLQAATNEPKLEYFGYYLKIIEAILKKHIPVTNELELKNQILGSQEYFNVSSAILGTGLEIGGEPGQSDPNVPKNLEDLFTLIHQNILVIMSALNSTITVPNNAFPNSLVLCNNEIKKIKLNSNANIFSQQPQAFKNLPYQPFWQQFKTTDSNDLAKKISFLGFNFNVQEQVIIYHYNMPLRGHSCFFNVMYDKNSKKLKITADIVFQFSGGVQLNQVEKMAKAFSITYSKIKDQTIQYTNETANLSSIAEFTKTSIENIIILAFATIKVIDY